MLNLNTWSLKHGREVTQLLKAQNKLEQLINAPEPDVSGLFNENTLESTLDTMIQHSLVSGSQRVREVNRARTLIENRLNQAISSNLDSYLEQAAESFDAAAQTYESYIYELPSTPFTAEDALAFTAEQREAYDKVCEAAGVLTHWMQWALELTELPAAGLGPWSKWHTIVDADNVGGLLILELEDATTGNPAYDRTLPVVARALREGATLRLATPTTARRGADSLEQERQEMPDKEYAALSAGLGY